MPQDFLFDFTFGGEQFERVVLTWGLDGRRRRRRPTTAPRSMDEWEQELQSWAPEPRDREQGVGWTVDVPEVHRMIDAVREGRATLDELQALLRQLTQSPSERSGCCVECDDAIDDHAAALRRHTRDCARFDDATTYPFLVTQNTIHAWDCYHFTGQLPVGPGRTVGDYVHHRDPFSRAELARLTSDEAAAWMDARTGPKGGLKWRRCRSCQPALPGAWNSESNDVPIGTGVARS